MELVLAMQPLSLVPAMRLPVPQPTSEPKNVFGTQNFDAGRAVSKCRIN